MWIKKLELENWQKHSELSIEFSKGVNVISGASDTGKSCIRRAISWITTNEKIDGIRKSGTKRTSVKITLDNDVQIERIRTASINRYIIYKNGKEDKTFDSIGKTIPEEVQNELQIHPIEIDKELIYLNSAPQIALPFLFDKSPSFRMKLFNKLTGNDILDKLFVSFNKDILNNNKELKREVEQLEIQEKELEEKNIEKEKLEAKHQRAKYLVKALKEKQEKCNKLSVLVEKITENKKNIAITQEKLDCITIPNEKSIKNLTEKVIRFEQLNKNKINLVKVGESLEQTKELLKSIKLISNEDLGAIKGNIDRFEVLNALKLPLERTILMLDKGNIQLSDFCIPELDYEELNKKIERLNELNNNLISLDKNNKVCYTLAIKIKEASNNLELKKKEYLKILKELKICPTCKSTITEKCLKEIKL